MSNRGSIGDSDLSLKNKKSKSIFGCRPVKYVCLSVAVAAVAYANYMNNGERNSLSSVDLNNVYSRDLSETHENSNPSLRSTLLEVNGNHVHDAFGVYGDESFAETVLNGQDIISYLEQQNIKIHEDNIHDGISDIIFNPSDIQNYYDVLNVNEHSDINELKRNFYNLSLQHYPNITSDNNFELNDVFNQLSEAYQVLSYQIRKNIYDNEGVYGTEKMAIVNPLVYFNGIFTSEIMHQYIGTTQVAYFVQLFLERNIAPENAITFLDEAVDDMMKGQDDRELQLTELLKQRLDLYINDDEKWLNTINGEINDLTKSAFSNFILEAVGWTYENVGNIYIDETDNVGIAYHGIYAHQADERINRNYDILSENINDNVNLIKKFYPFTETINPFLRRAKHNFANLQGEVNNLYNSVNVVYDNLFNENINITPNEHYQLLQELLKIILNINLCDIEETIRECAYNVLKDKSVDANVHRIRARRLILLGNTMRQRAYQ
ncbi:DnaJ protein, putative [Plasmodium sp. gorilla clade G2]|uniref:DnaJ protein, putative n=1 Tax=Plasmodium sp. gorilla clade G2 TaxID=880535 RepID=UPI000D21E6A9|nr:DnaJ protein, putative [Plasmodium sp. gorilla clade G2]SOV18532.1 DnaJ protein, putative [Plasmodium sp. gorilla clade G2]